MCGSASHSFVPQGAPAGLSARGAWLGDENLAFENAAGPLAHVVLFGYDGRGMLSRAQEARVREIRGRHTPGTLPAYCLEHPAATAQIPPAHLADLAAFVRSLRAYGACQTRYGGICDASGHATAPLLVWGPPSPMAAGGSHSRQGTRRVP